MSSAHETEEEGAAGEENEGEESGGAADDDNNSAAEEGDEQHYVVERIMEEMLAEDGNVWYLIRWEGYEPDGDTWEPYEHIKQCTDIIASWEATKAGRAKQKVVDRKRSRSATAGDESGSGGGRNKKRNRTERSSPISKRRKPLGDGDDDSDASRGTADSFMNELKDKNEGTFNWLEDIRGGKSDDDVDSDVISLTSLTDKERKRRKTRKEQTTSSTSKTPIKRVAMMAVNKKAGRPSSSSSGPSKMPHFPLSFGQNRSLSVIKPAKRTAGQTNSAIRSDDRRQLPKSLSHLNNIRKKQRQELPPDPSQIAVFRPDSVLTSAGRSMRAGGGFDKAVGDVETAISLAQRRDSPAERKEQPVEKSVPTVPPGRRASVAEALAKASKIREEAGPPKQEPKISPLLAMLRSPKDVDLPMEDIQTSVLADAWLNPPSVSPPQPRRNSFSSPESHPSNRPTRPRRNSTTVLHASPEPEPFHPPSVDVLPTVPEDSSRQWAGELLYSKDLASFGTIRLHIPESSIRIPNLPSFAGPTICLKKLVSAQYLNEKWLSATAHPSKKPDCLIAEFANLASQTALVQLLQNSSSAALVIEENCTLIFFPKHNSRLRPLFNVDSSNNPIGVALLNPLENFDSSIAEPSHADELLLERRLPYSSILSYDGLDSYIKDEEHYQFSWLQKGGYSYVLHSPPASLETDEMEAFLYCRGGHLSSDPTKTSVLLINRLYQSCLNYIPHLSTLKHRLLEWPPKAKPKSQEVPHKTQGNYQEVEIYLFGSYLDHQMQEDTMKPVFGNGLTRIFPGGGIICFTIDHLLEYPQHIKSIISYNDSKVTWSINIPESMLEKMERVEKSGTSNTENFGDVLVAIAMIREQIADKRIKTEYYPLHDFGVNSYMPFMNFLQNREYESVRRFILVHPRAVSGGQWDVAGNGIEIFTPQLFDLNFRGK